MISMSLVLRASRKGGYHPGKPILAGNSQSVSKDRTFLGCHLYPEEWNKKT